MNVGSVFFWNTDQAIGYDQRNKYHVFIRPGDWQFENIFLFVNKADYGGGFKLLKADYDFFPLEVSYVDCNSIVEYSDGDLDSFPSKPEGRLSDNCLKGIYRGVEKSGQMPGDEKRAVMLALYEYLKDKT